MLIFCLAISSFLFQRFALVEQIGNEVKSHPLRGLFYFFENGKKYASV